MNFDERLKMYLDGGFINSKDVENINKIIQMFKDDEDIELTEENAGMFIAHLCAAYSRLGKDEEIDDLPDEVLDEIQQTPTYEKSLEIFKKINKISEFNDVEKKYVLLHLNNLLSSYHKN